MVMKMKISIVTITYDDLEGLKKTARSVMLSSYKNIEWIVIDGGTSSVDFQNYFNGLVADFKVSERDGGIYYAMKKGLDNATGDYVVFLNSGDVFSADNSLFDAVQIIGSSSKPIDVAYFSADVLVDGKKVNLRTAREPKKSIWHSVPGNQQSTLYSIRALRDVGIPLEFKICGDYALSCKLFSAGYNLVSFPHVILSSFSLGGVSTFRISALVRDAFGIQRNILKLPIGIVIFSVVLRYIALYKTLILYKLHAISK